MHAKGSLLSGRVHTLKPFGALVTLHDGSTGIIHNRELSWEPEPAHPSEILTEGQPVQVMVLGIDREGMRLNLSLRQASRDPWIAIDRKYPPGKTVRGQVVGLLQTGAFVELEPAINGFVSIYDAGDVPPKRIEESLWIGDAVEGVIKRVDHEERHVSISIKHHLANLNRQRETAFQEEYLNPDRGGKISLGELLDPKSRTALLSLFRDSNGPYENGNRRDSLKRATLVDNLPRVLIADNDRGFRASLERLLTRSGHVVDTADSAEKAVALCSEKGFDLLLMDFSFRTGTMDGLEASRRILQGNPDLPIVIVTGIGRNGTYGTLVQNAKALGVRSVLLKPVELGSIYRAMEAITSNTDAFEVIGALETISDISVEVGQAQQLTAASEKVVKGVHQELVALQKLTGANVCVLFQMDTTTREVRVCTHVGTRLIGYETLKYKLQASPVAEVIQHREQLFENDVSRNRQKYRHLRILNFASCIGVPIGSFGHASYGLFLFHEQKEHFTKQHLSQALTSARIMNADLTNDQAERLIRNVQPFAFIGHMGSILVHELNNRLGSMLNDTRTLKADNAIIEKDASKAMDPRLRNEIRECIVSLEHNSKAMEKIAGLHMGLLATESQELLYVNEVLHNAIGVLSSVAEESRVRIVTQFDEEIPPTLSIRVRLEQSLANVILNAIQHVALAHQWREILVRSRFENNPGSFPIKISITDTGPGIHGKHLEHIFELGFSTRPGGHGLGLYAAKSLIESLGGRIRVEKSVMLIGTTFLIELPLVVPSVQGTAP
jgi:signal transduction histidine kinase/predicted RNA-binding protein with RPS1 domain/CheY-like chemotaxis protein